MAAAGAGLVLRADARPTPMIANAEETNRPNPTGNPDFWRCAHFHLLAVCPGYLPLVTEIHFQDEPKNNDPMYRAENAIAVERRTINGRSFETGVFDIVLEREKSAK